MHKIIQQYKNMFPCLLICLVFCILCQIVFFVFQSQEATAIIPKHYDELTVDHLYVNHLTTFDTSMLSNILTNRIGLVDNLEDIDSMLKERVILDVVGNTGIISILDKNEDNIFTGILLTNNDLVGGLILITNEKGKVVQHLGKTPQKEIKEIKEIEIEAVETIKK